MLDLTSLNIPPEVLSLIPKDVAVNCRVVPLSMKGEAVRIAVPLGCDVQTIDDISFFLGRDVVPEKVPAEDIIEALQHFYDISEIDLAKSQTNNANQSQSPANAGDTDGEPLTEVARRGEASTDGSTVATVDRIITQAVRMKASDIHVEPYEKFMRVRYRLDGVLHEVEQLPIERSKPIISRLKIMSELDIAEKRRPQDGRIWTLPRFVDKEKSQ